MRLFERKGVWCSMFVQCVINSERKLSYSELCRSDSDSCKQFIVKMTQPKSHFLIIFSPAFFCRQIKASKWPWIENPGFILVFSSFLVLYPKLPYWVVSTIREKTQTTKHFLSHAPPHFTSLPRQSCGQYKLLSRNSVWRDGTDTNPQLWWGTQKH